MAGHRPGKSPDPQPDRVAADACAGGPAGRRRRLGEGPLQAFFACGSVLVVLVGVAVMFWASFGAARFFGEDPSPQTLATSLHVYRWAAGTTIALAGVGCVLAAAARRNALVLLESLLLVGAVATASVSYVSPQTATNPPRPVTTVAAPPSRTPCYSGSTTCN